jgi:hypothetical protein
MIDAPMIAAKSSADAWRHDFVAFSAGSVPL